MTTLYTSALVSWQGETVAILAGGPSLTAELAATVAQYRRIVVNYACRLAPDADMLVALDGNWPQEFRDFAGIRVTGIADDSLDALDIGHQFERVALAPNHVVEIRNSGLAAIRLAADAGAAKILLLGFDPEVHGHFSGYPVDTQNEGPEPYIGMSKALAAIIAELRAQGIAVERLSPAVDGQPGKGRRRK